LATDLVPSIGLVLGGAGRQGSLTLLAHRSRRSPRNRNSMELSVAVLLVLAFLFVAFAVARRAAKARRKKMLAERERRRRRAPKYNPRPMSERTEMRAYDDPSTLAGDMTTMGSPPTTTNNPQGTATATARPKPAPPVAPRTATGKRSRAPGKPHG
jgi:hypothetical protein